uniref:Uncharacterized protein n=1 Tax=Sphaerodactylus townsendi TaxID=933632 RepID=A0ACB8EZ03_9SAUR
MARPSPPPEAGLLQASVGGPRGSGAALGVPAGPLQTRLVENQPYDESLDVAEPEDVASLDAPSPAPAAPRPPRAAAGAPPRPDTSDDDDDDGEDGEDDGAGGAGGRLKQAGGAPSRPPPAGPAAPGKKGGAAPQRRFSENEVEDEDEDSSETDSEDEDEEHGAPLEGCVAAGGGGGRPAAPPGPPALRPLLLGGQPVGHQLPTIAPLPPGARHLPL